MERLSITDYSRQEAMDRDMDAFIRKEYGHAIVGCGGVGFWLGIMLAMNGVNRLVVSDGQRIEPTNLNRIPVPQTWVGTNKTIALRKLIKSIRPECQVQVSPLHILNEDGFATFKALCNRRNGDLPLVKVLWDCTDDARVQRKLSQFCRDNDTRFVYRKLGYEGYKIGSYTSMDSAWINEDTYQPGYRTSRANAMSSVMAAALGVFTLGLQQSGGHGSDVTVDIKELIQNGGTVCTSTNRPNTTMTTQTGMPLEELATLITNSPLPVTYLAGTPAQR